jgi:uncharacterized protein
VLTAVGIVVGLLFLAGIIGSIVPWVPGPLFILAGAILWAVATEFVTLGWGRLAILGALAGLTFLLDFVVGALGARCWGASRWGVVGAIVGALVGLFFGPLGLVFGSALGAVTAELVGGSSFEGGLRSGFGAMVGLLTGFVVDLLIALTMIGLFLHWVWRG